MNCDPLRPQPKPIYPGCRLFNRQFRSSHFRLVVFFPAFLLFLLYNVRFVAADPGDGMIIGTTKIVDSGLPGYKFNLVIVSEGYTQQQMGQFASDAQAFVNQLFATAPFGRNRYSFNVYRVDVASTESGADDPTDCGGTGTEVSTYFDATFCGGGAIRRLLIVNSQTALNVLNNQVPEWNNALFIVNSNIYGGSGGAIGVTSKNGNWSLVAFHELGHSAFGLADEYEYYSGCGSGETGHDFYTGAEPAQPNVTKNTDRSTLKWRDLVLPATPLPSTQNANCALCDPQSNPLPPETVGAFEGARYFHCALYRPAFNCMMRNLTGFCPVCSARIDAVLALYRWNAKSADYTGDKESDLAVWRRDPGTFFVVSIDSPDMYKATPWGNRDDVPVQGDFDGDGRMDPAVYRPGTGVWYALLSGTPGEYSAIQWGLSTDIPAPGDYDGDGKSDLAVWRPSTGAWYVLLSGSPGVYSVMPWGLGTDIPVPGDYDGNGKANIAVWRPGSGVWYIRSDESSAYIATHWGLDSDIPVPGDYDGDLKTDIAAWRPASGFWYVLPSGTPGFYTSTAWGMTGDTPVSGDYDGDGKTDIAVWRADEGVWYILRSGSPGSYTAMRWGMAGDIPISSTTGILGSIP